MVSSFHSYILRLNYQHGLAGNHHASHQYQTNNQNQINQKNKHLDKHYHEKAYLERHIWVWPTSGIAVGVLSWLFFFFSCID